MSDDDPLAPASSSLEAPGSDWSVPDWLASRVTAADVIGLGEASHGSRTVRQWRRQLVEYLVGTVGVRTLALEAPLSAVQPLDAYVLGEREDGDAVVAGLDWLWATAGVLELVNWVRAFNAGRDPADCVRLRGIDIREPATPAGQLVEFIERVDPSFAAESDAVASLDSHEMPAEPSARAAALDGIEGATATVRERIQARATTYAEVTSPERVATARHLCSLVERCCDWHRVRHDHDGPHEAGMARRDEHMAANVRWTLQEDRGDGVAVLAHDAHVKRGTFADGRLWDGARTMGDRLAASSGLRYCAVGVEFTGGEVRALSRRADADGPVVVDLPPPRSESFPARVTEYGRPPLALDPRALRSSVGASGAPRLLDEIAPGRIRSVGSVYDPTTEAAHYRGTDGLRDFDALVFVGESRATRPVGD